MAINYDLLSIIGQLKSKYRINACLALGYPDILASDAEIEKLFPTIDLKQLRVRPDSDKILKWHGAQQRFPRVYEASDLFNLIELDLTVLDFKEQRGGEIVVDLNYDLPRELHSRWDFVLDTGTLEHLFHPSVGFLNCFRALRPGGIFLHASPLTRFNHGFWSFNPIFYSDFCKVNDVRILWGRMVSQKHDGSLSFFEIPWNRRFNQAPSGAALIVVFEKGHSYQEFIPIQSKYLS